MSLGNPHIELFIYSDDKHLTQSVYVLNQWFICKRLAYVVSWHLTQGGRNTILICTFFTLSQTALGTPPQINH